MKNIVIKIISFLMALLLFVSCPFSVYASDHGGGGSSSTTRTLIKAQENKENREKIEKFIKEHFVDVNGFFVYAASQLGAVLSGDYTGAYKSYLTMEDIINSTGLYVDDNGNPNGFYISAALMEQIKKLIDDYAKENQPFFVKSTHKANQIPVSQFISKTVYNDFIKYSKEHNIFFFNFNGAGFNVTDFSPVIKEGGGFYTITGIVPERCTCIRSVDGDWNTWEQKKVYYDYHEYKRNSDGDYELAEIHKNYSYWATNSRGIDITSGRTDFHPSYYPCCFLVTSDGGRIRVFKSLTEFMNYSVGQRKVYYTSNYYDYVPEDLTVAIDDLQKTIDDMQDVIDKLLEQITDNTSESEIEELLRLILEELRKNPGTGGGGSGGGDVNVDIDLSTTNSWLAKIYAKISQIADDFKSFFIFKDAPGINAKYIASLLESIHLELRSLWDEIHKQLTGISGDLSDIKKQLETMSEQEFNEKSDSFLGEIMDAFSEISEVVKTKFPFSIPNDLRIFLSKIAPAPPETEEQQIESYSLDMSGISLYSGEHGGGGTSDGEVNPPGGGGSSRPGSGFVDVDHGGSGGSRDPVEMREAPVFRLPIVIERYGIEEYIIIDMTPFDPLSRFSRGFFTIIFMVCLFNLTFKVIGMWGDLVG